jgi:hypothetical protein
MRQCFIALIFDPDLLAALANVTAPSLSPESVRRVATSSCAPYFLSESNDIYRSTQAGP